MKLDFIALDRLTVSKTNMRYGRKAPDIADILPSVRKRGILQPVIVRPVSPADDGEDATHAYEIVAGARRFGAACAVAAENRAANDDADPDPQAAMMPCAILEDSDDADAVEASLIENIARLDASEVAQWATFTQLVKEGRGIDDIARTFGLPELAIRRVLALGNLLPRIRTLYAAEQIDRVTVRHLTLASKSQQKAWLALADDDNAYLPTGYQLKAWLFGGQSIPTGHALFDVEASGLAIVADLFGEESYFADSHAFWAAQDAAIEAKRAALIEDGWADAVVVGPDQHFSIWEYAKAPKRKSGRVYIDVRASGEIVVHEGYVSRKEAARLARGETGPVAKPQRPEITATMATYLDLHRHAAVRAQLLGTPGVALRLMVAHAITGSPLWRVNPEPQTTRNDAVRESLDESRAETVFDERRRAVLGTLDMDPDAPTVAGGNGDDHALANLFRRLLDLPDALVMEVIAIVIGETLASGSAAVEAVGVHLGVDMADWWRADAAFFELLRDREVLARLVAEVAGENVAEANKAEKTKTLKTIIRDRLEGDNGREKRDRWVPRWMAFPPSAYTQRGGVATVAAACRAGPPLGETDPDPAAPTPAALPAEEEGGVDAVGGDTTPLAA